MVPRMKMGRMRRLTRRLLVLCAAGLICAAVSPWRLPALPASVANADQVSPLAAPPPETLDPLPLDEEALSWVESTLANLSLRDRAAQVVVPWISGASASENGAEFQRMLGWVRQQRVGGLIVSTGRPSALAAKLNAAQQAADVPLLIVSDLETGPYMRLRPGGTNVPPAMAMGAAGSESLARAAGELTGVEARAVGIHMTLGPVLDVNSNPANPIINVRSFGEDPEQVARLATAWIQGARSAGLQTAGKHFPGHGDTEVDSHLGLATISGDLDRLAAVELLPFHHAIVGGMDGVLAGHIAVPAVDGAGAGPATLSPGVIQNLLREQMGFDGFVITDAFNMGAITERYSIEEASIRALLAGVDVLLQPPGTASVIDAIAEAVRSGRLPQERLDSAARRMLMAKAKAGLHKRATVDEAAVERIVGRAAHHEVARQIAEASITLVRDRQGLVPLGDGVRSVLHITYTDSGRGTTGGTLTGELQRAGYQVEHVQVGSGTSRSQLDALRSRAKGADLVIASVVVAPYQYRALGVRGGFPALIEELAAGGVPVVAVSLGSPYLLDSFPSVPAYLLAWSSSAYTQRAAAAVLLGRMGPAGRLPVSLPPYHGLGEE